jgi:hypothetical protein
MARLAPLIDNWLSKPGNTQRNLSELAGVPERRIYNIRKGYDSTTRNGVVWKYYNVEFMTADKLLTAMGMENEWYLSLLDIYEAEDE